MIKTLNSRSRYRLGLIVTGDLKRTPEEDNAAKSFISHTIVGLAASFDWRKNPNDYITPIQDQGDCGSCVAFGTTAAIEACKRIADKNSAEDVKLSEEDLFSHGGSCLHGWTLEAANSTAQAYGICHEKCWPYGGDKQPCYATDSKTKTLGTTRLTSDAAAKQWIATYGPIQVAMDVYDDFFDYTSGIYTYQYGDFAGSHCVCIVGYDDNQGCWIGKNSWSTQWGEEGFFRIAYGECGILRDYVAYGEQVGAVPPLGQTGVLINTTGILKADISINGTVVGQTDGFVSLAAGNYSAILKKTGYQDYRVSFSVVDTKVTTQTVTMVPVAVPGSLTAMKSGTLYISLPSANNRTGILSINGRSYQASSMPRTGMGVLIGNVKKGDVIAFLMSGYTISVEPFGPTTAGYWYVHAGKDYTFLVRVK